MVKNAVSDSGMPPATEHQDGMHDDTVRPDPQTLAPAVVSFLADGTAFNAAYGDVYHIVAGALGQARHVFLGGNGLPQRWADKHRFTIVETGFGTGLNFLATWLAWRTTHKDGARLHFVAFEQHPLLRDDLRKTLLQHQSAEIAEAKARAAGQSGDPDAESRSALAPLAEALIDAWPSVLTRGLHRLKFDNDRVTLTLVFGDACTYASQLKLRADAFYLDGFAPARNPAMWQPRLFKALARMADEQATIATYTSAGQVRRDLGDAGFVVRRVPGFGGKATMTVGQFAPRWRVRRHPPPVPAVPVAIDDQAARSGGTDAFTPRTALVVGAGVAGCAVTDQLIQRGWRVVLIDQADGPASGASGNPAGIFHPVVTRDEGRATRWSRAAFLYALRYWRMLETPHESDSASASRLRWSDAGLVQRIVGPDGRETRSPDGTPPSPTAIVAAEEEGSNLPTAPGLPAAIAERITASTIETLTGVPVTGDGWWFKEGGWIDPRSLIAQMLDRAERSAAVPPSHGDTSAALSHSAGTTPTPRTRLEQQFGTRVGRLSRDAGQWCAYAADGRCIAQGDVVVLANAADAARVAGIDFLPTESVRGQLTVLPLPPSAVDDTARMDGTRDAGAALGKLKMPLIGGAYAIPLPATVPIDASPDGVSTLARPTSAATSGRSVLTGASYQVGVDDTTLSIAEHRENMTRLAALLDRPQDDMTPLLSANWSGSAQNVVYHAHPSPTDSFEATEAAIGNAIGGRAAVRCVTGDRMPYIGQLPDTPTALATASALRGAHLPDIPRMPGLFGVFGLGSRGILWSALAAECVANLIEGEPTPLEGDLLEAMDPARFLLRHLRRAAE
jgi:tRNA 5-methylaminomethyl-2-thiouridine biosynthesis bifunctional protein